MQKKTFSMRCSIALIIGVGAISLNTSCTLLRYHAPHDLTFISINLFDTKGLPDPDRQDVEYYKSLSSVDKVLRVEFSSKDDIQKVSLDWNNKYISTIACKDWKDLDKMVETTSGGRVSAGPIPMSVSSVYRGDIDIFKKSTGNLQNEVGPFVYHFYIAISGKPRYDLRSAYDLNTVTEDVCFQISAAEMFGAKTNIVTIPKAAIAAALQSKLQ